MGKLGTCIIMHFYLEVWYTRVIQKIARISLECKSLHHLNITNVTLWVNVKSDIEIVLISLFFIELTTEN